MVTRTTTNVVVIHCAATPPSMDIGVETIRKWHVEDNGWRDVGYHYVIRRDGSLEIGRREYEQGAHVGQPWNKWTVGICLVGGVDEQGNAENNFTEEQFTTLKNLCKEMRQKYPECLIIGHRDLPDVNKACPSFDVKAWEKENV